MYIVQTGISSNQSHRLSHRIVISYLTNWEDILFGSFCQIIANIPIDALVEK